MIVFLINGRCYHSIDWVRTYQRNFKSEEFCIVTDMIESEGYKKLIQPNDNVIELFNVDSLMFSSVSKMSNLWRNALRFLMLPVQAIKFRTLLKKSNMLHATIHAHTMYYILLAWLARVKVIGTPQGSEILVRPKKSAIYKFFAVKSLIYAKAITVDSLLMKNEIEKMSGVKAVVIQNGIDVHKILSTRSFSSEKAGVVSFRGVTDLYQTNAIFSAFNQIESSIPLSVIYPFFDLDYKRNAFLLLDKGRNINDFGRVTLDRMISIFSECVLAVSIPSSDSSPRSVYEAIFSNAVVAVTELNWIKSLPYCMLNRIIVVDLSEGDWLKLAYEKALKMSKDAYIPSPEALQMFDENVSVSNFCAQYYFNR